MTIPLTRLREYPLLRPGPGEISLAVARHQAEVWPSPEVIDYAQQRSMLLHRLVDDLKIPAPSWGETDGPHPREVVEIVIPIVAAVVPLLGELLMKWIAARPRKDVPSVPGFKVTRSDGSTLEMTYRTVSGDKEALGILTAFLGGATSEG